MTPQLEKDIAVLDAVRDQAHAKRLIKRARYRRVNARRSDLIVSDLTAGNPEYDELQRIVRKIVDFAYLGPQLLLTEEVRALLRTKGIDPDG